MKRPAVFIDKDGTLIEDIPYNVDPDLICFTKGAEVGLQRLMQAGYRLVIVTNQSGVARGFFPEKALEAVEAKIREMLRAIGVSLDMFVYCPHHPDGVVPEFAVSCDCRKPSPGMIINAAKLLDIDLSRSWMIGDILNDIEAGNRAGCKTLLIDNGNETEWVLYQERQPTGIVRTLEEAASFIVHAKTEHHERTLQ